MKELAERLLQDYAPVAGEYLRLGGEQRLEKAYEMGRHALSDGLGLLDAAQIHSAAVMDTVPLAMMEPLKRTLDLFAEALAPFEMALSGYRDAISGLQRLTSTLEQQVAERTRTLSQVESRFRSLVERLPATTYVAQLGPPTVVTYVSPQIEALLGYRPDEWLELELLESVHPDDRERVQHEWRQASEGAATTRSEFRLISKDDRVVWVREEATILATEPGEPPQRQGFLIDISEQRVLEGQLRQSQKMEAVGQLAGGVAHDFNNLLTAILSFNNFVIEDLGPAHPSHADLEEVAKAGRRAAALTKQLLAFSRRQVAEPQALNLNEIVCSAEKMLRRLIGEDIDLVNAPGAKLGDICADQGYIEQVLLNLVVNARDAMPKGGKLTLETANAELDETHVSGQLRAPAGSYVMLAVTDTGIGMDDVTCARIFEPFFTTKGVGKGTGLGLSTVYGIVKQLGGDIIVYSALGRGTTFKIYFPRLAEGHQGPSVKPVETGAAKGTETLLLVEDDPAVRAVALRTLRALGYTVVEAPNPIEALNLVAARKGALFDLLLTDVVMPQMSGPELVSQLAGSAPGMRVLFMSGYTGGALAHQGVFESGAEYLQKPFTPALLGQKVRAALDAGAKAST